MAAKVLGQASLAATTDTDVYTVPSGMSAVVSTLAVANMTAGTVGYRVAVRPGGATIADAHYIAYGTGLPANSSDFITIGITLAAGDVVTVYAEAVGLSVSVFGDES